jgi:hypothetical protein
MTVLLLCRTVQLVAVNSTIHPALHSWLVLSSEVLRKASSNMYAVSAVGRLLIVIAPVVFDVIVLPFGNCTFIGRADVVSCKPVASERRRRV